MPPSDTSTPFADFDFDLGRAVTLQLVEALDRLPRGAMESEWLHQLESRPGVYELFHDDTLVYIGKSKSSLSNRLKRHHKSLRGRRNINMDRMAFRALYIHPNWTPSTHEDALLQHFQNQCSWNYSGFGSNDPGRERDTTIKPPEGFDQQYPIKDDWECPTVHPGTWGVLDLLRELKATLPYLLRFEGRTGNGHVDFQSRTVEVPRMAMTAKELLALAASSLPSGWQATVFPSHMILYKESRPYIYGRVIWPVSEPQA